MIGLQN